MWSRIWVPKGKDIYGEELRIPVNRSLNPWKFAAFFGDTDAAKKPIVNPSETTMAPESLVTVINEMARWVKAFTILVTILPLILQKYPELASKHKEFLGGVKILMEYINS